MRTTHLATALVVSLSCALLTASCIQGPTAAPETDPGETQRSNGPEPTGEALQESGRPYESKDFQFVVVLKDDGEGPGGGWQEAEKTFGFLQTNFLFPVYHWRCRMRIEMPIRCKAWGTISPDRAAGYSAKVATAVVDPLLDTRSNWTNLGEEYCKALKDGMNATFKMLYPKLGARVLYNQ